MSPTYQFDQHVAETQSPLSTRDRFDALHKDEQAIARLQIDQAELLCASPAVSSPMELFDMHEDGIGRLKRLVGRDYAFLKPSSILMSVRVNGDVITGDKEKQLRKLVVDELFSDLPKVEFHRTDIVKADLAVQSIPQIHKALCDDYLKNVVAAMECIQRDRHENVMKNFWGSLTYHPENPKVQSYDFYRTLIGYKLVDRKTEHTDRERTYPQYNRRDNVRTIRTKTVHRHTAIYVRETHDLYATHHPLPAPDVPQPPWVTDFINSIHPDLWPGIHVVAGPMFRCTKQREQKFSRDVEAVEVTEKVISTGRLVSPCVMLADTVMIGWSGEDLPKPEPRKSFFSFKRS